MANLKRWPARAFSKDVLKSVSLPYTLPIVVSGLASLTGSALLTAVWPWLFLPAAGLHALLTAHAATRDDASDATRRLSPPLEAGELEKGLAKGFEAVHAPDGVKALNDLIYEYQQLQPLMERRRTTDSMSVAHIPGLALETYKQGLSVLQDALDLTRAISASDRERLESDIAGLHKEITALQSDPDEAARLQIRQEQLASDQELLKIMKEQQLKVDQLLFQSDRCGASLHRARMELAGLRADASEEGVNAVTETLRMTIDHAKGVQEEMKKLGA